MSEKVDLKAILDNPDISISDIIQSYIDGHNLIFLITDNSNQIIQSYVDVTLEINSTTLEAITNHSNFSTNYLNIQSNQFKLYLFGYTDDSNDTKELAQQNLFLQKILENICNFILTIKGTEKYIDYEKTLNTPINFSHELIIYSSIKTKNEIVLKAIDYINDHLTDNLTLSEIAKHVYVSDYYLSKLFKQETGLNFSNFLNVKRTQKAMDLLENFDYSVEYISKLVGFTRVGYFSQIFKKYTGVNPTQYRKNKKAIL
ncbi:helix-turn-helix domain-containing protein [Companilactobacillus metriopterae]|uniref:helix-turn-helix domain-containing protein n=1 Tax=Companilactobacillus metriopterae TaxID=1909267 RepID=UPI00100BAABF|nr:helix-turn-helix domain-containing protein [Companilactobacillus metriopterae]